MVLVSSGEYHFRQINRWREGLEMLAYVEGPMGDSYIEEALVQVPSYFIDKNEVTNAEFKKFLDATGYKPKSSMNFLKHWKKGTYPKGQGNHPVVYVDLWDAKAYADWAGKRIPTEVEWQYAAQGADGRIFPWGDRWDPKKANVDSDGTEPVGSYPAGASPFGALDMTGNVSEMTDSYQEDGWHRFSYLRGGSWFQSFGSLWYVQNGLVTNQQRVKFWMMNAGFNRSPTVGFRCVKEAD
jgi:formylglycine-generating enzyme required for sulfatase activity